MPWLYGTLSRELIDDVDDANAGERPEELERRELGHCLQEGSCLGAVEFLLFLGLRDGGYLLLELRIVGTAEKCHCLSER